MTRPAFSSAALAIGLLLGGCTLTLEPPDDGFDPPLPDGAPPPVGPCFDGPGLADRSMAVTEAVVMARFGFERVMTQIRATAGVAAVQTNRQIFQSWMKTFGATGAMGDCNDPGLDPNGYGLACPRTPELKLSLTDPFSVGGGARFQPVGLFNRFDLAPADGAHCGEYRIVYGMSPGGGNVFGRALLIFEAALPNPDPAAGVWACMPVAQFWQSLNNDDEETRARRLEAFYFTGGEVPGFPAVVDAKHYGLADAAGAPHGAGQVRTNFFIDFLEWNLREFKLRRTCGGADPATCRIQFAHVPAENNLAPELFAGTHARAAELRQAFLSALPSLITPRFAMAMGGDGRFSELESVSSRRDLEYRNVTQPAFRMQIRDRLAQLGSQLSPEQVLNRATFETCAGCHELSNFADLGGAPTLPSLTFVHIDEAGQLSPALQGTFLPERAQTLISFIGEHCDAAARVAKPADGRFTVGGSRVGAHN